MKILYNKIITIRALMLVILTSFFAFGAQAQIAIDQSPGKTFNYIGAQDTVSWDTTGTDFNASTIFYLHTGNSGTDFTADDVVDETSADTFLIFNWPEFEQSQEILFNQQYFISAATNLGSDTTVQITDEDVSIGGSFYDADNGQFGTDGTFEMTNAGTREIVTDPISALATSDPASLFVRVDLGDLNPGDSLLVQYRVGGTGNYTTLTDTNDSSYFDNKYLIDEVLNPGGTQGVVTLEFELEAGAKNSDVRFRIKQFDRDGTSGDYTDGNEEWFVNEDDLRVEIGNENISASQSVGFRTIRRARTQIASIEDRDGNDITGNNLIAGDTVVIEVTFLGYEDQSSDYNFTAVIENQSGTNEKYQLGSQDVTNITESGQNDNDGQVTATFSITGIVPNNTRNYGDNWNIEIQAYTGTNPTLGTSRILDTNDPTTEFDFVGNSSNTFDGDGERTATSIDLEINSVTNASIVYNITDKSANELSPTGTEIVIEYSVDGGAFTQIGDAISLNDTLSSDRTLDISSITALTSGTVNFRVRQLSNSGAGLDTWSLDKFNINTEGSVLEEYNPLFYSPTNRDLNSPTLSLDAVNVPTELIFPGDEVDLTFSIDEGTYPSGTEIMAHMTVGATTYEVGSTSTFTAGAGTDNTITITIPAVVSNTSPGYSVELKTTTEDNSNAVNVPVYGIDITATDITSSSNVTDGGVNIIYPGDEITVDYEIEGNVGSSAELFLEIRNYNEQGTADDEWDFVASTTNPGNSGAISGTISEFGNFDDPGPAQIRLRIGNGLLSNGSIEVVKDIDANNPQDISGRDITSNSSVNLDEDIFIEDEATGVDFPADNYNRLIGDSERSVTTYPFDLSFGGDITVALTTAGGSKEYYNGTPSTILLQASNDGNTFTTIDSVDYEDGMASLEGDLPESLWSDSVYFKVVYNTDAALAEWENAIDLTTISLNRIAFTSGSSTIEDISNLGGEIRRPRVSLETLDDVEFVVGETLEVEYTTEGTWPANTSFALVFTGTLSDNSEYGEVVATSSTLGLGTFSVTVPNFAYEDDGTERTVAKELFDQMEVFAYDASNGASFQLDETISIDEDEDFLVIEGTDEEDGDYTFDQVGDRSLLTDAYDLSSATTATLEFVFDPLDVDVMDNRLTIPQLQVSTDAGETFTNLVIEENDEVGDGYLYQNKTYEVDVSDFITSATHFRWYQALNLGEDNNEWRVNGIKIILSSGNEIETYYEVNNEQTIDVIHPVAAEFFVEQTDENDAVFNNETVNLTFGKDYETTVDYPAGTEFTFLLWDGAEYIEDPATLEPYILGETTSTGAFDATVPFYVENGSYEIHMFATADRDEEFSESGTYFYAGSDDPLSGVDVGDLDVFLRAAITTIDVDENDVIYAGSTVTFNVDVQNAETNTDPNTEYFTNLLVKDYDNGDDLLIASEAGIVNTITVDLPPFIRESQNFIVEYSENAALGQPLDLIGSMELTEIEDDFEDNFINGQLGVLRTIEFTGNEDDVDIRNFNGNWFSNVRIDNFTSSSLTFELVDSDENQIASFTIPSNTANYNADIDVSRFTLSNGEDFTYRLYNNEATTGSFDFDFIEYYDQNDFNPYVNLIGSLTPSSSISIPEALTFNNDLGRGVITTRDFEAGELDGANFLLFDLTFDESFEDVLDDQFLIIEYSTDGGATYTELGTLPEEEDEDGIDDETYSIELTDDMLTNNTRFRWRQEERAGITVELDNITFTYGEVLPFDYVGVDVNINPQTVLVTSVSSIEACLDEEFEVGFEVRGRMGADNIVQVQYANAFNNNWNTLSDEFMATEGTGTVSITLPSTVVTEGSDNESFKFRFTYDDGTFEDVAAFEDSYEGTGPQSEVNIEIIAPADTDADISSVNGDPLSCEGGDVIIEIDDTQDYFMYEILDQDGNVLGMTTYDPEVDTSDLVNIGAVTEFVTLSVRITALGSSGTVTCNTVVSSETLEVEPLADYALYSNNGGAGSFRLAEAGETVQVCENQTQTILELGRLRADGNINYDPGNVEWFVNDLNNPVSTESDLEANDLTVSGNYFARVTTGTCSYTTETIAIEIIDTPDTPQITVVSGTLETCSNADTVVLAAPEGFAYYQWRRNGTSIEQTQQLEVTEAGTYTVQVSNLPFGVSCASIQSIGVVVERFDLPELSIAENTNATNSGGFIEDGDVFEVCESSGFNVYFYDDEVYSNVFGNIEIIRDGVSVGFINGTNNQINIDESGNYSFIWSNDDNVNIDCSVSTVSFTVNIVEIPDRPTLASAGDLVFCQGEGEVTLTAPAGFTKYIWFRDGSQINTEFSDNFDDSNNEITVTRSGDYTVRVANLQGCRSIASNRIEVEERTLPGTAVSWSQVEASCGAGEAVIQIFSSNANYLYQLIEAETGTAVGTAIRGNSDDAYYTVPTIDGPTDFYWEISYADGTGCVNSNPNAEFNVSNNNVELEIDGLTLRATLDAFNDAYEVRWYRNGNELRNQRSTTNGSYGTNSSFTITVMDNAEYSVEVYFRGGCVVTSNAVAIENNANGSVQTFFGKLEVASYPNPSTDVINVSMKGGALGSYDISLMSMSGQIIISKTIDKVNEEQVEQLDVQSLENGIYNLRIQRGDSVENFRIVKQ